MAASSSSPSSQKKIAKTRSRIFSLKKKSKSTPSVVRDEKSKTRSKGKGKSTRFEQGAEAAPLAFPGIVLHTEGSSAFPGIPLRQSVFSGQPHDRRSVIHLPSGARFSPTAVQAAAPDDLVPANAPALSVEHSSASDHAEEVPLPSDTPPAAAPVTQTPEPASPASSASPAVPAYRTRMSVLRLFDATTTPSSTESEEDALAGPVGIENLPANHSPLPAESPSKTQPDIAGEHAAPGQTAPSGLAMSTATAHPLSASLQEIVGLLNELVELRTQRYADEFTATIHQKVSQITSRFRDLGAQALQRYGVADYVVFLNSILVDIAGYCLIAAPDEWQLRQMADLRDLLATSLFRLLMLDPSSTPPTSASIPTLSSTATSLPVDGALAVAVSS